MLGFWKGRPVYNICSSDYFDPTVCTSTGVDSRFMPPNVMYPNWEPAHSGKLRCDYCGRKNHADDEICESCGAPL